MHPTSHRVRVRDWGSADATNVSKFHAIILDKFAAIVKQIISYRNLLIIGSKMPYKLPMRCSEWRNIRLKCK